MLLLKVSFLPGRVPFTTGVKMSPTDRDGRGSSLLGTLWILVDDAAEVVSHGKYRNTPPIMYGILGPHCCRILSSS
jgi:hypothetical protein